MASSGNTWFKKLQAKQRANTLRALGVKQRFAVEPYHDTAVKKIREYLAPASFARIKPRRGRCVLSHEKRLMILERSDNRAKLRAVFFAELRGQN